MEVAKASLYNMKPATNPMPTIIVPRFSDVTLFHPTVFTSNGERNRRCQASGSCSGSESCGALACIALAHGQGVKLMLLVIQPLWLVCRDKLR